MTQPGYPVGTEPARPYRQPSSGDPGTLDLPYYGISFKDAIVRAYRKYVRLDGRASRSEFWWFQLFALIAGLILEIPFWIAYVPFLNRVIRGENPSFTPLIIAMLPLLIFELATLLPQLGLTVRRLHDGNYSGWLYLLSFIPFGAFVVLALCIPEGKPEGRRFDRVS